MFITYKSPSVKTDSFGNPRFSHIVSFYRECLDGFLLLHTLSVMAEKDRKPDDSHLLEKILERKAPAIDVGKGGFGDDKNTKLPPTLEAVIDWVKKQLQ